MDYLIWYDVPMILSCCAVESLIGIEVKDWKNEFVLVENKTHEKARLSNIWLKI